MDLHHGDQSESQEEAEERKLGSLQEEFMNYG